jgi:HEAT repeat protein
MGFLSRKSGVEAALEAIDKGDQAKAQATIEQLLGEGDADGLVRILFERDHYAAQVLEALGSLGDPSVVPQIIEFTRQFPRREAFFALGRLGDERAIGPVAELMAEGPGGSDAVDALVALAQNHRAAVIETVLPLVDHKDSFRRGEAISCLRDIRAQEAVPKLVELLEGKNSEDRTAAAIALKSIGGPEAEAALAAHRP